MSDTATTARAEAVAATLGEHELDQLVVGDLVSPGDSGREAMAPVSWICGFRGSSGLVLVGGRERPAFITDFRYIEAAARVEAAGFEVVEAGRQLTEALAPELRGRVGFDPGSTSVKVRDKLAEASGEDVELVAVEGIVERLRRVKDAIEIEAIRAASELTDAVYAEIERDGLAGRSEREVATWIESRMRELGAEGPSFPPIVAAGPNGALPHAVPGDREIGRGELVVCDLGAICDGYCSDGTRTYATGPVSERAREVHELVGRALEAGCEAL
ncbi:MAG: M24 family metallopeptidase, partial [Solirubrobacterales bacterium]